MEKSKYDGKPFEVIWIESGEEKRLLIDGVDLNLAAGAWVGGAAPTAGGSGGTDTFTFNILKTASATYTVVANFVKCSA